jgi:hypothetical protein
MYNFSRAREVFDGNDGPLAFTRQLFTGDAGALAFTRQLFSEATGSLAFTRQLFSGTGFLPSSSVALFSLSVSSRLYPCHQWFPSPSVSIGVIGGSLPWRAARHPNRAAS